VLVRSPTKALRRRRQEQAWSDEVVELERKHDEKKNAETTPPETERIRLRGIWVTEAYPVSLMDALARSLRALVPSDDPFRQGASAVDHLLRLRRSPGSSGLSSVGVFVPPGSPDYWHANPVKTDIPVEFKHVHGNLVLPLGGLVLVSFLFVPTEGTEFLVEDALRRSYTTYGVRRGPGTQLHPPDAQKEREVDRIRDHLRSQCARWLSDHLPGFFASPLAPIPHPTLELWTCLEAHPFAD
jgi:hypothetical protein